jgi:hypothetical protein
MLEREDLLESFVTRSLRIREAESITPRDTIFGRSPAMSGPRKSNDHVLL